MHSFKSVAASINTVVWTGDLNIDYKIALVLVLWAVIRTKL
ncbi:hypothetical protein [Parasutterella excrementihominis]|nr:hypothetical protein [Parasutterella excrementihominis]